MVLKTFAKEMKNGTTVLKTFAKEMNFLRFCLYQNVAFHSSTYTHLLIHKVVTILDLGNCTMNDLNYDVY